MIIRFKLSIVIVALINTSKHFFEDLDLDLDVDSIPSFLVVSFTKRTF